MLKYFAMSKGKGIKIISENRKAHFNYFLSDFLECGIALKGTEIVDVPIAEAVAHLKRVDPKGQEVRAAVSVGTSFGANLNFED